MEKVKIGLEKAPINVQYGDPSPALLNLIAEVFASARLAVNVYLYSRGGGKQPLHNGKINIFINAHADYDNENAAKTVELPRRAWGYRLCSTQAYRPKSSKTIAYDDVVVAEVEGLNIFVLFKAIDQESSEEDHLRVLERIFLTALGKIEPSWLEAYQNQDMSLDQFLLYPQDPKILNKLRKNYVCYFESDAKEANRKGRNQDADLKKISSLQRTISNLELIIADFDDDSKLEETLGREFDKMLSDPKIEKIIVKNDGVLEVYTDTLYCRRPDNGVVHTIGKMKIVLDRNKIDSSDNNEIRFFNQTQLMRGVWTQRDGPGQHAPHVNAEGQPCLGNTKTLFKTLLKEREYAAAITKAIVFIESVNTGDPAGKYIDKWPIAPPSKQKSSQDLEQRLKALKIATDSAEKKITSSHTEIETIREELSSLTTSIEEWNTTVKTSRKEYDQANSLWVSFKAECRKKRDLEPKKPQKEHISFFKKVRFGIAALLSKKVDKLGSIEKEHAKKMSDYNAAYKQWDAEYTDLLSQKNQQEGVVNAAKKVLDQNEAKLGTLNSKKGKMESNISDLRSTISDCKKRIETSQAEIREIEKTLANEPPKKSTKMMNPDYKEMKNRYINITKSRMISDREVDKKDLKSAYQQLSQETNNYVLAEKSKFFKKNQQTISEYFRAMFSKVMEIEGVIGITTSDGKVQIYIVDQGEYFKISLEIPDFAIHKVSKGRDRFISIPLEKGEILNKLKTTYLQLVVNYEHEMLLKALMRYIKNEKKKWNY